MSRVENVSKIDLTAVFQCPVTRSRLRSEGGDLVTHNGELHYPVRNGIPCFLSGEAIEDDAIRRDLKKLNRIASQQGWREALNKVYGPEAAIVNYVTDESRANFLGLLELDGTKSVLEIGPGLGQFSWIIAKRVGHLYGVEGQAQFAAIRCRQEGVRNATFACGGDDCRLPFQDESMDIVLLNLVFEWCSTRN